MNRILVPFIFLILAGNLSAQDIRPTKNLIVMIPDGTSASVLSAARWLEIYRQEGTQLNIDPYLTGSVTTFAANSPIGESASTTSTYMTGIVHQTSNVAMYPVASPENDLSVINPDSAYQPLATILEAMKMEQNKAVGLVVTCEFPHATPADCSAHYYDRKNFKAIASQMAFNNLNVMFGGGNEYVSEEMKRHFKNTGTTFIQNDKKAMLNFDGEKVWALFQDRAMSYDLDRNPEQEPSISEMTEKALEILNKNQNGFFLMVEGSKVDGASHANDPAGILSEYLAFDKAVGKAIEFAKKDRNTTVVILPDHGNSGFTIGRSGSKMKSLDDFFGAVSKYQRTASGLEKILRQTKPENFKSVFKNYTGLDITDDELKLLLGAKNYQLVDYTKASETENMSYYIAKIYTDRTGFGFTTGSHTGEDVFLAVYHPQGDILTGNVRNTALHRYLHKVSGLQKPMSEYTARAFSKHSDVFAGMKYQIIPQADKGAKLIVNQKRQTLEISAFSSIALLNGKPVDLGSVAVYMDKNNTFYIPKDLREKAFGSK